MNILIVEDDEFTQKAIMQRLKLDGYEVKSADNAEEAIEIIEKLSIDILLVDIHMPGMTGLELIEYIRDTIKKTYPIIVISRIGNEPTILKAFEIGADDYITKPFEPDELSLRVKKIISKHLS